MLIKDFSNRLRAIGDKTNKELTFNFNIKTVLTGCFSLDVIKVDVYDKNKKILTIDDCDLVEALKALERKLIPAEIVINNGEKFMKVDIDGKTELLKIK